MNKFPQLKEKVLAMEDDFAKFYEKKNQTAGTRVRKALQELKNLSQEIRIEVQEIKNKGK